MNSGKTTPTAAHLACLIFWAVLELGALRVLGWAIQARLDSGYREVVDLIAENAGILALLSCFPITGHLCVLRSRARTWLTDRWSQGIETTERGS